MPISVEMQAVMDHIGEELFASEADGIWAVIAAIHAGKVHPKFRVDLYQELARFGLPETREGSWEEHDLASAAIEAMIFRMLPTFQPDDREFYLDALVNEGIVTRLKVELIKLRTHNLKPSELREFSKMVLDGARFGFSDQLQKQQQRAQAS